MSHTWVLLSPTGRSDRKVNCVVENSLFSNFAVRLQELSKRFHAEKQQIKSSIVGYSSNWTDPGVNTTSLQFLEPLPWAGHAFIQTSDSFSALARGIQEPLFKWFLVFQIWRLCGDFNVTKTVFIVYCNMLRISELIFNKTHNCSGKWWQARFFRLICEKMSRDLSYLLILVAAILR